MYIPKICDDLKKLTDEEAKDFIVINFREYFKSSRGNMYSKLSEEQNRREVAKFVYIFLTILDELEKYAEIMQSNSSDICIQHYNVEISNTFDPELQLINTKPMIKNTLKKLLSELKRFKVQKILVLEYKKRNDYKIFHSSIKLMLVIYTLTKDLYLCIKAL